MKEKNNKVIHAGIGYMVSNFLIKGLAFLTMPIFTRIMTENDIGIFSNIISWFNILAIITTFEIYSSVNIARFDYKDDLDSYISSSLMLGTLITSFFYIIVLIFHNFFENLFLVDFKTLNIMFIYLLVYPSIQMYQIKNQIDYNYKSVIIVSLINAFLSTFISIFLVLIMDNKLFGRIYGYFIPLIFCSFIIYIILIRKSKKITRKYWKYALKISFPLIWHLLAGYILSASDKIMITKIISAEKNALYSVAYTLSSIVSIIWLSMNNAWSPWAYEQMDKKKYYNLKNKSKPYTIFYLLIVIIIMLFIPELLYIFGGKNYSIAKFVIPPIMVGYIFQFIYSLYVNIEFYHKKQKNIAIGTVIAAIINVLLNYILLPKYGYIVAAYTTLIGYIVLYIIHYYFVKKINCNNWYDNVFFNRILALSLLLIPIFTMLYKFNIFRYILIIFIFVIVAYFLINNYNYIIKSLKQRKYFNIIEIFRKR